MPSHAEAACHKDLRMRSICHRYNTKMCMPAAQAWIDQLAGQGKAVRYRQGRAGRGRAYKGAGSQRSKKQTRMVKQKANLHRPEGCACFYFLQGWGLMQTMPALPQQEEEGTAGTAGRARPQLPALGKQQPRFQHCYNLQIRHTAVTQHSTYLSPRTQA